MVWSRTTGNLSLHALCNSPFRSKGTNFGIFNPFSSISQRLLLSQQTQQNVEVNTRRFYCVHPPTPTPINNIPRDLKGFLEWYNYKSFETVPYTNRTRRILAPRGFERRNGEIQFKEFKEYIMENEGMVLPPTHPDVVRVNMVLNNIISALQRELKKMGNATSSYNSIEERIWMSLLRRVPAASTSHLDGLDWEVLVVNFPDNPYLGICFPGGKIAISHKLVGSDIEIATTISHEVAHLVARHASERWTKFARISSLISRFGESFTKHFGQRIISLISQLPSNRRLEFEADYIGLILLASAGYDPRQVPEFYEKYDNFNNDSMLGGYLSSHPSGRKRARALTRAKIMQEALAMYNDVRAGHIEHLN